MKKYLLAGTLLTALGATAHADTIPVVNSDFSQFPAGQTAATYLNFGCAGANGPGCAFADNVVFGWVSGVLLARTALSGQWQIGQATNVFNTGASPEPIVLRDINTTVSQTITGVTAQAGVTYTLNIDLGFDKGQADLGNAELWIGGKEAIASPAAGDPALLAMQYSGNFYDYVASYTATSADAGDAIEIILSSLTGQTNFAAWYADVRLSDSLPSGVALGAPEPSTWVEMGIGFAFLALLGFRRARNRLATFA
jgi:hypothetical protein